LGKSNAPDPTLATVDTPDLRNFRERLEHGDATAHPYVVLLGLRTFDTHRLMERVREGLPYSALEHFTRNSALPRDVVSELLQISPRTLARRKDEGRLHLDESDRLLRASRVLGAVLALFEGDVAAARRWLTSPLAALGGASPLDFARTEMGTRELEALIGRLEHGIPA
jgi:putative toxin-antitoxin system antitoxin component (TIGR02293 family)